MTYRELLQQIASDLKQVAPALLGEIPRMIAMAELELWPRLEANFMRASYSFITVPSIRDYEIPADQYPLGLRRVLLDDQSLKQLGPHRFYSLAEEASYTGKPTAFSFNLDSRLIRFDLIPDDSWQVTALFWRKWPALQPSDDESTNPLLGEAAHLLRLKVLARIPTQAGLIYAGEFEEALRDFNTRQNYDYFLGAEFEHEVDQL